MQVKQVKRELSLLLVIMMAAVLLTGCSEITAISLHEDGSGSYKEVCTMSKDTWDLLIGNGTNDDALAAQLKQIYPQASITIQDITADGTKSKRLRMEMEFKNVSEFENTMSLMDTRSVNFNSRYFSQASMFLVSADGESSAGDTDQSLDDVLSSMIGENPEAMSALMKELENADIQTSITFPYTVLETNGTKQEGEKTVVWDAKQMADEERMYAVFTEQASAKAPTFSGAKNNKYYNTAVTLKIHSQNLLDKVKINDKTTVSDYASLMGEGTYTVTAVDRNKNKSKLKFYIDMTKPTVKGVKNNGTYKNARTIQFSDKGSGISKAVLNGKKIRTGKKVTKKGSYMLVVTDKAGNKKTVKFKLK